MKKDKKRSDDLTSVGSEPNEVMSAALDLLAKVVDASSGDLNKASDTVVEQKKTAMKADGLRGPCFMYDHGDFKVACCKIDGRWICVRH